MNSFKTALGGALLLAAVASSSASAAVIPYGNVGTEDPTTYSFVAPFSGNIYAYFFASDAGYDQQIELLVNGVPTGVTGLPNHSSAVGEEFLLGHVSSGDTYVFADVVSTISTTFYSDKSLNADGFNHIFSTAFGGNAQVPGGTYVGFEDLVGGGDKDYNDMQFVFRLTQDVVHEVPAAPEISTWLMMLIGFAGVGFAAYRRTGKQSAMTAIA